MIHHQPLRAAALALLWACALAPAVRADAVRLVAADDRGGTLELAVPADALSPANEDGRSSLTAGGLTSHGLPGRPILPSATTLVALPPGARAILGAVEGGETV